MAVDIVVEQNIIEEIKSELGYPIIQESFPYSPEEVKSLFLWPSMRKFFQFFPIPTYETKVVSSGFEFPFPDEKVFGVVDARLNVNNPTSGGIVFGNPVVTARNVVSISQGSGFGKYGTRYNYGFETTYLFNRAENQALKNENNALRVNVDTIGRKLTGYSNLYGRITITWASYSEDFGTIPFDKVSDVINLAQSAMLKKLANVASLQATDAPNDLDASYLSSRADDLETAVIDRWKEITKVVVLRR